MKNLPYWLRGLLIGSIVFGSMSLIATVIALSGIYNVGYEILYLYNFSFVGVGISSAFGFMYGLIKGEKIGFYWLKGGLLGFILGQILYYLLYMIEADVLGAILFFVSIVIGIVAGLFYGQSTKERLV